MANRTFILPVRPYSLIDAINRYSLATGSFRNAVRGRDVDYNGHRVSFVEPNQFKRYWTCYFFWAGIHTIGRGTLADCLKAARAEYDRGALGSSASVTVETDEDARECEAAGFVAEPEIKPAVDPLFAEVPMAFRYAEQGICPSAIGFLANSKTIEEYNAKIAADIERQKAERAQ